MIKTKVFVTEKEFKDKEKKKESIVGNKQDKENKEAALHFEDYTSNKNKL